MPSEHIFEYAQFKVTDVYHADPSVVNGALELLKNTKGTKK